MKKKINYAHLGWYLLLIFKIATFGFLLYKTCIIYSEDIPRVIIFTIVGFIYSFFFTTLIHEFGHLISGLAFGLKFNSIRFLWFKFYKKEGRLRFSFSRMGGTLGETTLYPVDKTNVAKNVGFSYAGGLLFTFIFTILSILIAIMSIEVSLEIFCVFGLSFAFPMYMMSSCTSPMNKESDGTLALNLIFDKRQGNIASNYFCACIDLQNGVEPIDLDQKYLLYYDDSYSVFSVGIRYLRYLSFLTFDENKAFKEIYEISDRRKIPSTMYKRVFLEMFFASLVLKDSTFIKENIDEANSYLDVDDSPTSIRIQATLCIYRNEIDRARLLLNTGIKLCTSYSNRGIAKFEYSILSSMLDSLQ